MPKPICLLTIFLAGVVAAINLSRLIPTNEAYEAAWWKVGLAITIAIVFGSMALRRSDET